MNTFVKALLAASALGLHLGADTPSVAGKWKVLSSFGGTENEMLCTFAQKDSVLTGNCTYEKKTLQTSGKVDGDKVTWSYQSEYQGTALTANYAGVITSATRMNGNVQVPEFGASGDFTASRSE